MGHNLVFDDRRGLAAFCVVKNQWFVCPVERESGCSTAIAAQIERVEMKPCATGIGGFKMADGKT
jgi:hypothetical protein